jgi:Tfp pilus assembly protein PilX
MKKGYFANEDGMTLVSVLMLLIVLSVLGFGLLAFTVNHTKMSSAERTHQSSYYIAEAGVTKQMKTIEDYVRSSYQQADNELEFFSDVENEFLENTLLIDDFESAYGEQPKAEVTIERVNTENPRIYKMTSVGEIGNQSRTVEKKFSVNFHDKVGLSIPKEMAVYTDTTITMKGGAVISGNIGTNSSAPHTVSFSGGASHQNGNIYVPSGAEDTAVDAPHYMDIADPVPIDKPTPLTLPPFPDYPRYPIFPDQKVKENGYDVVKDGVLQVDNYRAADYTLNLNDSASFTEIKLGSNYTLTINVGNTDKSIVVDHLNVQNGHINLKGTGRLIVYVNEEITMGAGSTINTHGSIDRLNVYLKDSYKSDNVKLSGSQVIYGSLYAETANIELTGGGGFQGHIFTGGNDVKISGGARAYSSLIYAPDATIRITGGGSVKGMILSDSFEADGGAYAEFEELNIEDVPFAPSEGSDEPGRLIRSEPLREAS